MGVPGLEHRGIYRLHPPRAAGDRSGILSQRASGPWAWPWRLDHSQASARDRPGRHAAGWRSTDRSTTNR